ncbi:MAG: hypothetical protein H0Z18_06245 [Thermococcus sp.]|uniref:hypothetical protein n=1 Tax=Thermococcus sp. TaxID=35749 RepID=UPI001E02F286|nr:hypothetical protein [Thermococcus sp.]MBO8174842.1 hypothetical protein [Thermococcus sp.]
MSFDQVVERMSSEMNALALDKVATEVSKEVQENAVEYHETVKIGVAYWKNIRVKSSQLNEEQCWKLLAQEIVKILDDWMTHKS